MNVGTVTAVAPGRFRGSIEHFDLFTQIAIAAVTHDHPQAPAFDVIVRSPHTGSWLRIGALWKQHTKADNSVFYAGTIKDPSLPQESLDLAFFPQGDGNVMNISSEQASNVVPIDRGARDTDPFKAAPRYENERDEEAA